MNLILVSQAYVSEVFVPSSFRPIRHHHPERQMVYLTFSSPCATCDVSSRACVFEAFPAIGIVGERNGPYCP